MIQPATMRFLKNLSKNNNKPWFDLHRKEYETARKDYEDFIQSVIDAFGKSDPSIAPLIAKQCLFRINRDIRFSKNKTPYKKNFAASINRGGKKSIFAGYYFHLEPGNSFVGGGIWMPMPGETQKIRQEIDYCWPEFKKIITSKKFRSIYSELDNEPEITLVNVPKGYAKDNPAAQYLKLKSWIAMQEINDTALHSASLLKQTVEAFGAIQPLIYFLNRAIEE
ncbi:DUF2461 domain-containing protein [Agriterribacter sp.]|uniref:DUF2461 domain-containing protein n=1 Tax=Agriterribacter sp. TaxID=2821509 RepID=UPI002B9F0D40|nr:DUF2461 domain-containing protein [Agriterribacter sp.]HTN08494.1 DUF2461 domain-containing protein [Agriterribacter sp.]